MSSELSKDLEAPIEGKLPPMNPGETVRNWQERIHEYQPDVQVIAGPYPWCSTPATCSRVGYCKRNPSCGD